MSYKNILDTIGNTPIVRINNFDLPEKVEVWAKIEGVNPGGSIKDRIALRMIEDALQSGLLSKNKTIIEATSGNTGIAIAMIAAIKGFRAEIVMSEAVSIERRKMIKAFGANIVLSPAQEGTDGAISLCHKMLKQNPQKYFHLNQYSNQNNKLAHYENTAQEIIKDMKDGFDYFVASIGTSGTLMGVSEYLKKQNPNVKIVSAEPVKGHYIQGLKNMKEALVPALYDQDKLDDIIMVDTEEAYDISRQIVKKEGIFVGMSSGAAMLASIKIAKTLSKGRIVTIFPDRGEKYLSTGLFNA
jgi:cysteine synthase B